MGTFGRGVWASLAALFFFCGLASGTAWAKAFDMEMLDITVTAKSPADQAGPKSFYVNAKLKIECSYRWGEIDPKKPPPPLIIGFAYDRGNSGNMPIFPYSDLGPPATAGTVRTVVAEFSPKEAGSYKISCVIMKKDNTLPGPLDVNLGNNAQYAYPVVKPRPLSKGGSAPPVVKAGQPQFPKPLPDITSGTGVAIGGKSASWGSSVAVDVKDAHSVNMNNSGLCEFGIKHTARNVGLASTGPFDGEWKNSNVPGGGFVRVWLPIVPGGSREETDLLSLKPGQNLLHLRLDSQEKVQESNENNNRFRIIVNVTGSCGPKPGIVPLPRGRGQGGSPSAAGEPVPRLPDPPVLERYQPGTGGSPSDMSPLSLGPSEPGVTGVIPYVLTPGKNYTLMLQGLALTHKMALDFGPGITIVAGSVKVKVGGSEGSIMVQVAADAKPGPRTVRFVSAPGRPWKVQPAKLAVFGVFVEPAPREQGPIKATPLK